MTGVFCLEKVGGCVTCKLGKIIHFLMNNVKLGEDNTLKYFKYLCIKK